MCFITNTEKSKHEGLHWVAFYVDEDGALETFDLYGALPDIKSFKKYIAKNYKHKTHTLFNAKCLQDDDTMICSVYCYFTCFNVSMVYLCSLLSVCLIRISCVTMIHLYVNFCTIMMLILMYVTFQAISSNL